MCTPNPNPKPVSIIVLAQKYNTRQKCVELLESLRWPNGAFCHKCGSVKAYKIKNRFLYECADCQHQFSVTSGTIMHRSHLPLTKWILAIALIANAKKGVSACQLARDLQVTYKTAWYLGHRIRRAMRELSWMQKFTGIVELDECYIGGRPRHKFKVKRGRGAANKTPVFGAIERGGKIHLQVMNKVNGDNIMKVVRKYIETDAEMVVADQLHCYNQLAAEFTVERINHTREYVRGKVHTNGIESIWAIVKRQVHGTHHKLSPQYLPLYLSEISYRFNHRKEPDLFLKVLRNVLLTDKQIA
jgi:transposase-like protein